MGSNILEATVSIAGPGRAARAFGRSWVLAGGRLQDVIARDPARASRAAHEIGSGRPLGWEQTPLACDLLVLGLPDDTISEEAERLARRVVCGVAFHLSGALSSRELVPFATSGASLGSLHPLRAFSGAPGEDWREAFVAIEGDEEATRAGELVVEAVGARGHRIAAADKVLYHAAATLAAGGALAVVSHATRVWNSLGIPETEARAALADLSSRAVGAAVARDFEEVFTGPVARRDLGTVRAHRCALEGRPEDLSLYAALARETLNRTPGRGKEEEILSVLEKPCS